MDKIAKATAKVACKLGTSLYDVYLSDRYGIDSCVTKESKETLRELHNMYGLLEYYNIDRCVFPFTDLTTNLTTYKIDPNSPTQHTTCDISKVVEKINRL